MSCEHEHEFNQRLTAVEERAKSNTHQIDDLKEQMTGMGDRIEAVNRLATAVEVMATKQDTLGASVKRLEGKVDSLESKPGKKWDAMVEKILWAFVAAVVAFLLGRIGL